jgi:hypothetical protein
MAEPSVTAGDSGAPAPVAGDPAATVATDGTVLPTGGGACAWLLDKGGSLDSPFSLRSTVSSRFSTSSPVREAIRSPFRPFEILAACGDEALVPCSPHSGRAGAGPGRGDADGSGRAEVRAASERMPPRCGADLLRMGADCRRRGMELVSVRDGDF